MLPLWNGEGIPVPKYGNIAIRKLIDKMVARGSQKKNLKAKIFGGSNLGQSSSGLMNVGERNIVVAHDILEEEKIPIVSSDLSGGEGRRLLFFTDSGLVRIRKIKKTELCR